MHPSSTNRLATLAACACILPALVAPSPAGAQQFAQDLDPVTFLLSPEHREETFPKPGQDNQLAPGANMLIYVNIAKTGHDKGHAYELSGEPELTAAVDIGIAEELWTRTTLQDSADALVVEYLLTNASPVLAQATLTVSCVWTPVTGYGGSGPRPDDLYGSAYAQIYLEQPVVEWQFDRHVAVYNLADHEPADRRINFAISFEDTAQRLLSSDQITDIEYSFPSTLDGVQQGDNPDDLPLLTATVTEPIQEFTNIEEGHIEPEDPDLGGAGYPRVDYVASSPRSTQLEELLASLDIGLAVDHNRDGLISFDDTIPLQQQQPFTFWLNDDRDQGNDHEANDLKPDDGPLDLEQDQITSLRDLEDFCRIHLKAGLLGRLVAERGFEVGLQFVDVEGDDHPAIRLYLARHHNNGAQDYLFDQTEAEAQKAHGNTWGRTLVNSDEPDMFPGNFFNDMFFPPIRPDNPVRHFLFEGVERGSGTLAVVIRQPDGETAELPLLRMSIVPVREMYEHWTVGDTVEMPLAQIPAEPVQTGDSGSYAGLDPAEQGAIVFVHGWRMRPWERRYFADTAYKRLWHLGFTGEFYHFSWPTEYTDKFGGWMEDWLVNPPPKDRFNYPASERKAYTSGAGLRTLLLGLRDRHGATKVHLFAHSMGNIVASEAIRIHGTTSGAGTLLHSYTACQSSMSAHAYGDAPHRNPPIINNFWGSPERYFNHGFTGKPYFELIPVNSQSPDAVVNVVNFFNPADSALEGWQVGQDVKPYTDVHYYCNRPNSIHYNPTLAHNQFHFSHPLEEIRLLSFATDEGTHEIYSWAAGSRSMALGSSDIQAIAGVNLHAVMPEDGKFTNTAADHSGQFRSTLMLRHHFWFLLLESFGLDSPGLPE